MHNKRLAAPKTWPVQRKSTKYILVSRNSDNSIPLLIVLRDLLKVVRKRKEAKSKRRHYEKV